MLLLAFARASALDVAPPVPADTALAARELRAEPLAGWWHAERDGRTGWIEPFAGAPRLPGHGLLFEPLGPRPASETPLCVLPGGEVLPWARGPTPAPDERARRFRALAPLLPDELVRLGPAPRAVWDPLLDALAGLRAWLGARVAPLERGASLGLLRALLTGERTELARERAELFARTGTSHLLAISGWHVGLFAALVVLPLSRATPRTRRSRRALLLRGACVVVYAAIAGAEKPVLRAALAVIMFELAGLRARGAPPRRPDGLSFLAAAFSLECLFDPQGVRGLSLSLSYVATLGLILGTGALAARLRAPRERWDDIRPASLARTLVRRAGRACGAALAASAAAVLATLPLTWATFGEFAPAGMLLTVLVLPPFTVASLVAWLGALAPVPALAGPGELAARALYALLEWGDTWPGTPLVLPPRPLALLWLATVLVFVGLRRERGPWLRAAAGLWALLLLPWSAAPSGLELVALDVGHGSALVARAPGLPALVYDAGSRDRRAVASQALLPLLARWEVGTVLCVLSHADLDHTSAVPALAERYLLRPWLGAAPAQTLVRGAHGGEHWELAHGRLDGQGEGGGPALRLLRSADGKGNESSVALELRWRGQRVLLLGDAEQEGLDGLELASGPVRLLLAPHHGSEARGLGALLERCPPDEVWVSTAERPAIADELERRGIPWRWTGRDGPLALGLP